MSLTVYGRDDGTFLLHGDEVPIGWIERRAVGFRGFSTRNDAIDAARLGHHALQGWLTRERHTRAASRPTGAPRTRRDGLLQWITIGESTIGRLVEPSAHTPVGASSFGFELMLPPSVNPVGGINAAQVIYHALTESEGGRALARLLSRGDAGGVPTDGVQ